jgi:hypothetical protein
MFHSLETAFEAGMSCWKVVKLKEMFMALQKNEICRGAVAVLDPLILSRCSDVNFAGDRRNFRNGPFVCVQSNDGQSTWLALTTQHDHRHLRLELRCEWKLEGGDAWRSRPQFINDARKPFVGPNGLFLLAGGKEWPYRIHKRPRISTAGVRAILEEMSKYVAPSFHHHSEPIGCRDARPSWSHMQAMGKRFDVQLSGHLQN